MQNNKIDSIPTVSNPEFQDITLSDRGIETIEISLTRQGRKYKSTAMLGLALSLGGAGVLLSGQVKPARATGLQVSGATMEGSNDSQPEKLLYAFARLKTRFFPNSNLLALAGKQTESVVFSPSEFNQQAPLNSVNNISSSINFIDLNPNDGIKVASIAQLPSISLSKGIDVSHILNKAYTVKAGDSLTTIASQFGVTHDQLVDANQIENADVIAVNQQLNIPSLKLAQIINSESILTAPLSISENPAESLKWSGSLLDDADNSAPVNQIAAAKSQSAERANLPVIESKTSLDDPYIRKLRAEIEQMRDRYQAEMQGDRSKTLRTVETTNNAQVQKIATPSKPLLKAKSAPIARLGNQPDNSAAVDEQLNPQKEFISVAPTSGENYNESLETPEKEIIAPELPPLSSAEHYLPTAFDGKYRWPAKGILTSGYGWRWGRMHKGIDIAAPIGTPILAAAEGEVITAGWNSGGYGNLVKMRHPDGSITLYAHNHRILVRRGQKVRQGQQIAEMGTTGRSTGPHLHFEIRTNSNAALNPIAFLDRR